jgi:hypothetical protein
MSDDRGHMRTMRLLPFAVAASVGSIFAQAVDAAVSKSVSKPGRQS